MSGITGDYRSLAEAAGEAPPQGRFNTADELAELEHDCGGDYEMMDAIVSYAHAEDARNQEAWYREHASLDQFSTGELLEELRLRGVL
jgi:hypothetical protein